MQASEENNRIHEVFCDPLGPAEPGCCSRVCRLVEFWQRVVERRGVIVES